MNKIIQYKDIPLTFYNYKEPLKSVIAGFGYYGVILGTLDGRKIQCHVCGKLFARVDSHIGQAHDKMTAREYKEKFELAYTTALISENIRAELKERTLKWLASMTKEDREKLRKENAKQLAKWNREHPEQPKLRLETKNKRGTCPDQLLEKIKEVAERIGHTPSKHEFIGETHTQRYVHLIYKTFGSWSNALKMTELSPREVKQLKGLKKPRYSNKELLEYLTIFAQENHKIPTHTDFRRGLLPSYGVYTRRFGKIENARKQAGVYNFINE